MADHTAPPPPAGLAHIGVRELRNQVAAVVRRARAGERLVVTVDGVPAAMLGPIEPVQGRPSLDDLIAAGLADAPRRTDRPTPPDPAALPVDARSSRVLDELRGS